MMHCILQIKIQGMIIKTKYLPKLDIITNHVYSWNEILVRMHHTSTCLDFLWKMERPTRPAIIITIIKSLSPEWNEGVKAVIVSNSTLLLRELPVFLLRRLILLICWRWQSRSRSLAHSFRMTWSMCYSARNGWRLLRFSDCWRRRSWFLRSWIHWDGSCPLSA